MPEQLWFPGTASAVGQARRFVAGVIGDGFPALDDVLVLVSEVASNAVKHTASGDDGAFVPTAPDACSTPRPSEC